MPNKTKHCEYFNDGFCKVVKTAVWDNCDCIRKKPPKEEKKVEGFSFQKKD